MNHTAIDNTIFNLKIKKPNKHIVAVLSSSLVIVLGLMDYYSGREISFSIFYLIPISIAVIFVDFKFGLLISFLSAVSWHLAETNSGEVYKNLIIPFWNSFMRFGYFILHSYLLSKLMLLYERTKIDSLTDPLTNAMNSKYFYDLFERELKKSRRTGKAFTLIYFDLDNFKLINDTYGHQAGDLLLKKLSHSVTENIRPSDIFARIGGDEFVLLLPETGYRKSDISIKRIKRVIEIETRKNNWPVTLSIGAITYKTFGYTIEEMIKQADEQMYKVKKTGKNNIDHILNRERGN